MTWNKFSIVLLTVVLGAGCWRTTNSNPPTPDSKISWTEYLKLSPEEQAAQPVIDRLDDTARAKLEARSKKNR